MASRADLVRLPRRHDLVSLAVVAAHAAFVLAPVYLAAVVGPRPLAILLWLWLGLSLHGLLNLMHESAHYLTFSRRWASDVLGRWVLGPLVLADFDAYRSRHWDHHRHLGVAGDTKDAYLISLRGGDLARLVVRALGLSEGVKRWRLQRTDAGPEQARSMGRAVLFQTALLVSLAGTALAAHRDAGSALAAVLVAYVGVYGYGVAALTPLMASLRTIAEHQRGADDACVVGRAALRNLACGPASRLLLGAWGFAEHATHHQEPAVPSYHLGALTAVLAEADPAFRPRRGYLATLRLLRHSPRPAQ